ncbi:MAG: MFS transporter [Bacteroidetes bacterium]|nr:MAG: MFS transporter [Bacteroidota bacterium]
MLIKTLSLYRNAYGGLSRDTWLLSFVMLVNRSGTMVIPFMTIYLTQPTMGYSIGQAGIVMGIFGAGAICGGFIGGKLTDKFGFHQVQLTSLVGGGLFFILLGLMKSYPLICIFTFLLSLVNESFRPANSTAIAHYSKEENRTRSYSLNRLAINLGWAIGGALGGILASLNYHLLFWTDGLTNILAALLLRHFLSPDRTEPSPEKKESLQVPAVSAFRDRVYLIFIVITISFATCFFQLFTTLPVFYKTTVHMSEFFIGLLMALNGVIITLVEMVLVFRLEGRRESLFYIRNGFLLAGISFLLINLLPASYASAVFCMILVTFGEILSMPFMNSFWISRTAVTNRGQYAGLYTIAWSIAQVIGPAGGAQVAERFGFRTLWWSIGGLCVITSIGIRWLSKSMSE